jgi:hypothetical protein
MASPILQAILLAEHVYQDVRTGKFVICGVFNQLNCRRSQKQAESVTPPKTKNVPFSEVERTGTPFVYLNLTNMHHQKTFELRYIHLDKNKVKFSTQFQVESTGPLETHQISLPVPTLPKEPGTYALELLCDNEPLGSHRVLVVYVDEKQDSES